ncbi:hypothetical protein HU200_064588 [Digitaria exilis]|uniref:ELMO domain-containing protein n=1 Tax=Digitaria exilis TaxID=1010633 RepID=A0A835A9F2_9POAL|nr:hypothetical protein HU200_064588 [Digitaria exilis]
MASKAIKRRPYSSETDKSSEKQMETTISHPVTEPLLGNGPREDKSKVPNFSITWVERLRLLRQRLDVLYDCSSVKHQDSFHRLLHKAEGKRAEWEYPFAAGGVNISYMLVQMLDLQSGKMSTKAAVHFVQLLEDDEAAFDNLFCVAFQEVLKSTRVQLEKELTTGCISSVQDLPSFRMLKR